MMVVLWLLVESIIVDFQPRSSISKSMLLPTRSFDRIYHYALARQKGSLSGLLQGNITEPSATHRPPPLSDALLVVVSNSFETTTYFSSTY
jgi:hypothetical protein